MSGGGKIIEKRPMLHCGLTPVVRYWLLTGESDDEICVYAEPNDEEPELGDTIWWGSGSKIWWGPDDSKTLVKFGFSFRPDHGSSKEGRDA